MDEAAQFTGTWAGKRALPPLVGDAYHHDGNADQGQKSARFTPDLPAAGRYEVRLIYVANANRATNVARHRRERVMAKRRRYSQRTGGERAGGRRPTLAGWYLRFRCGKERRRRAVSNANAGMVT